MEFLSQPSVPLSDLLAGKTLSPGLRSHLSQVYGTLCYSLFLAGVGACVGGAGLLASILGFVCLIYIMATSTPDSKAAITSARFLALSGFSLFTGMGLNPLISLAIRVNPALILTALFATSGVFVCFSLAALLAPKNYYLYLGGILSGTLSILLILSIANIFFGARWVDSLNLGVGLLVMMGYVLYDTQVVIYKFESGHKDYIANSVGLFIDFIGIFVRILIILLRNAEGDKKKRRD
jgi:FtsH-binding integral membrane protein